MEERYIRVSRAWTLTGQQCLAQSTADERGAVGRTYVHAHPMIHQRVHPVAGDRAGRSRHVRRKARARGWGAGARGGAPAGLGWGLGVRVRQVVDADAIRGVGRRRAHQGGSAQTVTQHSSSRLSASDYPRAVVRDACGRTMLQRGDAPTPRRRRCCRCTSRAAPSPRCSARSRTSRAPSSRTRAPSTGTRQK